MFYQLYGCARTYLAYPLILDIYIVYFEIKSVLIGMIFLSFLGATVCRISVP